jgi:lysophospholipase L1-like esterase
MAAPFDVLIGKLIAGNNAAFQVCGDSTGYGAMISTPDTLHGWVGRLAINIGIAYDVNVRYRGGDGNGFFPPLWTTYNTDQMLNTSTRTGAPTLTVYNGSLGGATAADMLSWINSRNLILDPNVDVVFTAAGLNDLVLLGSILPSIQNLVVGIRNQCANASIVVTTENRTTGRYPTSIYLTPLSTMTNYYVGQSLDLNPPLMASTVVNNVWVMDTKQAYPYDKLSTYLSADVAGGLHPSTVGYQAQADWMYSYFATPIVPAPVITTTSLNTVVRGQPFTQTLAATGLNVAWSVVNGSLPTGLVLNATSGTIYGTPTQYGGSYSFTVRATNSNGSNDQTFTGSVIANTVPFNPTGQARFRTRAAGTYYPVTQKIKLSGSFRTVIVRD